MRRFWAIRVSYEGYDEALGERIEKAAGREADATGYGFGRRDFSWYTTTGAEAYEIYNRLVRAELPGVEVEAPDPIEH